MLLVITPNEYIPKYTTQSANFVDLFVAKRSLKEAFDWNDFKERFTSDFGKVEEKRYSLEQLLEYANRKFGKTLEDLILQNQISWQRRQEYAESHNMHYQSETTEDTACY